MGTSNELDEKTLADLKKEFGFIDTEPLNNKLENLFQGDFGHSIKISIETLLAISIVVITVIAILFFLMRRKRKSNS